MKSGGITVLAAVVSLGLGLVLPLRAQDDGEQHGRKYKSPPTTSRLEITVLRETGSKPIANAAVIFHTNTDGDNGNMEVKTGPDGKATIDVIPTGSYVGLQVIADGYETHGSTFHLVDPRQAIVVHMHKPSRQVSAYEYTDKGLDRGVGVREPDRRQVDSTAKVIPSSAPIINLGQGKGGATLSGRVTGYHDSPVSGATVTVTDASGAAKPIVTKTTDDGLFALVHVPAGKYTVSVTAGGYVMKKHDAVVLSDAQAQVLDTHLLDKK